jgi:hypothetical protein
MFTRLLWLSLHVTLASNFNEISIMPCLPKLLKDVSLNWPLIIPSQAHCCKQYKQEVRAQWYLFMDISSKPTQKSRRDGKTKASF